MTERARYAERHQAVWCYRWCVRDDFAARPYSQYRNALVPPWLEILFDLVGFAGFIGLATWHKAPCEDDRAARR